MTLNGEGLTHAQEMRLYQLYAEIRWLNQKMVEVKELMKRKPSKLKYLQTLERQSKERQVKIDWMLIKKE